MPAPETPSAPVRDERVRGHRSGTRAILADRIGDKRTLAIGASLLPLFAWLDASRTTMTLVLVQSAFGLMVSSFTGVAPKALSGLFPTAVRTTGVSLVYNTAITVFGGFAPAILTWLTQSTSGSVLAPAWYVVGAAAPAIAAISTMSGRASDTLALTEPQAVQVPIREP